MEPGDSPGAADAHSKPDTHSQAPSLREPEPAQPEPSTHPYPAETAAPEDQVDADAPAHPAPTAEPAAAPAATGSPGAPSADRPSATSPATGEPTTDGAAPAEPSVPAGGTFPVGLPAESAVPTAGPSTPPRGRRASHPQAQGDDERETTAVRRRSLFSQEPAAATTTEATGAEQPAGFPALGNTATPATATPETASDTARPDHPARSEPTDDTPRPARTSRERAAATAGSGDEALLAPAIAPARRAASGAEPDDEAPDADDEAPAAAPLTRMERRRRRSEDDILLAGSTVVGRPASRAADHWWGVLVAAVLLPLAWFLLHDASAELTMDSQPHRFALSVIGLVELALGSGLLLTSLWMSRKSSLGAIVIGTLSTVAGLPFLVMPEFMSAQVSPVLERLADHSNLGSELSSFIWTDAATGRFVAGGLMLVMIGLVSHSARRAGRREQEIIDRDKRTDPTD